MKRRTGVPNTGAERKLREETMVLVANLDEQLARIVMHQWAKVNRPDAKDTISRMVAMAKEVK